MNQFSLHSYLQNFVCQIFFDLNIIWKQYLLQSFIGIHSISCCAHIANSMDSFKSCMTHEHRLELQWYRMHKQHVNESFIEYESWLTKQNDYARKKYAKIYMTVWKQRLEQSKNYMQNQHDMEIEKKNVRRLDLLTYFKSLDVETIIGLVESPRLHHIYDMVKLCLTTRMDESICVLCDNLVPNIIIT
jgi:hypothetical protein